MRWAFFSFGGSQFWSDVFFYQKWRIQRNVTSKTYRLLDPWDIVRATGNFEECRKAFVKLIDIYQLPRQKGHMIIMLHGFGDSKNIFKPLWRKALERGYLAAAINYPSMQADMESHIRQLIFLLNNLEDVQKVSFVTKGIGGIILRKLFNTPAPWQERLKIGRIVQVCPPNQGSRLIADLTKNRFINWIFGPMAAELTPENVLQIPDFPEFVRVGIVYSKSPFRKIMGWLPEKWNKYLLKKKDSQLDSADELIEINNQKLNIFKNRSVVNAVLSFLDSGKFRK